jgi:hypothetical protein
MVSGDRFFKSLAGYRLRPEFFCQRAKSNVRAKGREVNSIFLVQLRKMLVENFCGATQGKRLGRDVALSRLQGAASLCRGALAEETASPGMRVVHRACTGNAERRWVSCCSY